MNKTPSHLISFDSESGGLARVCLALTKTDSEAPWRCPSHIKTIGADRNPRPLTVLSLTKRPAPPRCIPLQSP
jgi:hypothetical protein